MTIWSCIILLIIVLTFDYLVHYKLVIVFVLVPLTLMFVLHVLAV
jgi:hypothetical protein